MEFLLMQSIILKGPMYHSERVCEGQVVQMNLERMKTFVARVEQQRRSPVRVGSCLVSFLSKFE